MSPRKTAGEGEKKLQGEGMVSAKALGWKARGMGLSRVDNVQTSGK